MAATTVAVDRLASNVAEMKNELLVLLARVMALAYCVIGAIYAATWLADPGPWEAISAFSTAILVAVSLASIVVARSQRADLAPYLLVGGSLLVVAGVSALANHSLAATVAYAVPIVLAGLLLSRRAVFGVAGVAILVVVFQVAADSTNLGRGFTGWVDAIAHESVPVLALLLLLSLLAPEYSRRLGSALTQLEAKAKDAERYAWEMVEANAEIERKMVELAAAKQEIEQQREVNRTVALEILGMARELAATSAQQASGASEQAAAMAEIVATMEELTRAASQIAGNSAQVSRLSAAALQAAETGRASVEETIAGLDRIRTQVRSVAEKNLALGQKTQAIGEIIEVITEIADRTHLLALNAAIESAAAGEYGRRFSVVASQVKELANESKSAAHQVRSAVAEIQRAANATVLAAEKGEAEVEAGAGLGRGAGQAIAQIVDSVEDVAAACREMLLATQQQQSASEQVVSTVREVEDVTRQSAEGSRQISQAVTSLIGAAERLQ